MGECVHQYQLENKARYSKHDSIRHIATFGTTDAHNNGNLIEFKEFKLVPFLLSHFSGARFDGS